MALETITQILAPNNAPYINGVNGGKRISAAILKNFYQGLVEKNDKGVNDNFVSEGDAENATQVAVRRVLPVKSEPREFGASKNGASYSQNQYYVQTEEVNIDILQVLDDVILIPRATKDRINVDVLAEQIEIWSNRWATIYNGATTAAKILSTYLKKAKAEDNEINEIVLNIDRSDSDNDIDKKRILEKFIDGNSLLDEGDPEHGIDVFDAKTRIAIFKVSFRSILKAGGILTLGGANDAYTILAGSGLNTSGDARVADDGFIGVIDGIEVRLISNESLKHAAKFLGFPETELIQKGGIFAGYIASSYASARGASTRERTKVVDEPNGQGIRLQPYVKFGAVCWYPLGNVFFTTGKWNPYGDLKTVFGSEIYGAATFKLKSYGSRLVSNLTEDSITDVTSSGFKVGAVAARDDWGSTNHVVGVAYVVSAKKCATVAEFLKAATAESAVTDTVDKGGETVTGLTIASTSWVNVLSLSDDGTLVLTSKQYVA